MTYKSDATIADFYLLSGTVNIPHSKMHRDQIKDWVNMNIQLRKTLIKHTSLMITALMLRAKDKNSSYFTIMMHQYLSH